MWPWEALDVKPVRVGFIARESRSPSCPKAQAIFLRSCTTSLVFSPALGVAPAVT